MPARAELSLQTAPIPPSIPREVIESAQAGSPEAFATIYETFKPDVFSFTKSIMRNDEDAADLTQDTFIKAYRALPSFNGEFKLKQWLYKIAYCVCIDELRHRQRITLQPWEELVSAFHPSQVAKDNPEEDVFAKEKAREDAARTQAILDRLNPRHRTCLILREYHELSYDEIAKQTGTTSSAVKQLLHRARQQLRKVCETKQSPAAAGSG